MMDARRRWPRWWLSAVLLLVGCGPAQAPSTAATMPTAADEPSVADEPPAAPASTATAAAKPNGNADDTPSAATPTTPAAPSEPHRCSKSPEAEAPVRRDQLGEGSRLIRVQNAANDELQVRLLDGEDAPAVPGTLRIAPGARADFRVPEGTYRLRYRVQSTCAVLEGSPIVLTGRRSGVEISLKSGRGAGMAGVKRVTEEL